MIVLTMRHLLKQNSGREGAEAQQLMDLLGNIYKRSAGVAVMVLQFSADSLRRNQVCFPMDGP